MGLMASAIIGSALVGGVVASKNASKAAKASKELGDSAAKSADAALDASVRQADELLDFNKTVYAEGKERQIGIDAINKEVIDTNLRISGKTEARADESHAFYMEKGRPVVEKTLSDAQNFDSAGNIGAARDRAGADVAQAFDSSAQQTQSALRRMGVNPSSGRFLALQTRLQADRASSMAGAVTNAEQGIRDQAIGLRQQASNLAQGFPAQALGQGAQSSGTGVAAAGTAAAGGAQHAALAHTAMSGMESGASIYGSAAGGYGNLYGNAMNSYGNIMKAGAQDSAGWGSLLGQGVSMLPVGKADGGPVNKSGAKVVGPGTGTSDDVPAVNQDNGQQIRLSNGEWIVPADVVKAKGEEFFQKLTDRHHKPVNMRGKR